MSYTTIYIRHTQQYIYIRHTQQYIYIYIIHNNIGTHKISATN